MILSPNSGTLHRRCAEAAPGASPFAVHRENEREDTLRGAAQIGVQLSLATVRFFTLR